MRFFFFLSLQQSSCIQQRRSSKHEKKNFITPLRIALLPSCSVLSALTRALSSRWTSQDEMVMMMQRLLLKDTIIEYFEKHPTCEQKLTRHDYVIYYRGLQPSRYALSEVATRNQGPVDYLMEAMGVLEDMTPSIVAQAKRAGLAVRRQRFRQCLTSHRRRNGC